MPSISSLCVYCGSRTGASPVYRKAAEALARDIAARGVRLVYGGGRVGLMGVIADAVLAAGGRVTGVIPRHLQDVERGHQGLADLVVVETMHERKWRMSELADGFVVLPGGLGTLDETFETVTWKQLGLHDRPIVIADIDGYWAPLRALLEHTIGEGFATPGSAGLATFVDSVADVFPALEAAPRSKKPLDTRRL